MCLPSMFRHLLRKQKGVPCKGYTPPRGQKASKVKQIWELWSVNVALAMSTWKDIAVTYYMSVFGGHSFCLDEGFVLIPSL